MRKFVGRLTFFNFPCTFKISFHPLFLDDEFCGENLLLEKVFVLLDFSYSKIAFSFFYFVLIYLYIKLEYEF